MPSPRWLDAHDEANASADRQRNVMSSKTSAPFPSGRTVSKSRRSSPVSQHVLERQPFRTSRLIDFCTERELTKQVGHSADYWPLIILKEVVDNALDAAEEANTAPVIRAEVANGNIVITDNGPGMNAETIADILDFTVRVSSREAYASPPVGRRATRSRPSSEWPSPSMGRKARP
jgi:hypothetical protein